MQETKKPEGPQNASEWREKRRDTMPAPWGAPVLNDSLRLQEMKMPIWLLLCGLQVWTAEWFLCLGPLLGLKATRHAARWPGQALRAGREAEKESFIPQVCTDPWGLGNKTPGSTHSLRGRFRDWGSQTARRSLWGRSGAVNAPTICGIFLAAVCERDVHSLTMPRACQEQT